MNPQDTQAVVDFIRQAQETFGTLGTAAGFGVLLSGLIKIWRLQTIQTILPQKVQWSTWPKWLCMLIVFGLSGAGSALMSIASGAAILPALGFGFIGGLLAMGTDAATGAAASALPSPPMVEADKQSIKVPLPKLPPPKQEGWIDWQGLAVLGIFMILLSCAIAIIAGRYAGAVTVQAEQKAIVAANPVLNGVSCTAAAADRWSGWIQVSDQHSMAMDIELVVGGGAPADFSYRCEGSTVNTTAADAGWDLPVLLATAISGVTTATPQGSISFLSATGGPPGSFRTMTRISNIPSPYMECLFTCGAGAAANDLFTVSFRGNNP